MALANCKRCGRLFNQLNHDICNICLREEEQMFFTVRDYLKDHRRAGVYEVSDATGVETTMIIKFIREGRLSTVDHDNLNFPCESCGTPIVEGRFCKPCKDRLNKGFAQTKDELLHASREKKNDYFHKRDR
jgi:flagellar operon protein (TIGR03826 family)